MKEELVVFLDFDGVLHHFFPIKEATDEQNSLFHYVPVFNDFIKSLGNHFDVKIVFATSWKEKFSYEDLRDFFEDYPEMQNAMIGATPNLKSEKDKGAKWREAEQWMNDNNYNGRYIIFDDYDVTWDNQEDNEDAFLYSLPTYFNKDLIVCNNGFKEDEIKAAHKLLGL